MDESVLQIISTIIESATAMGIAALALMIVLRFSGQKTDPKLISLIASQSEAGTKRDEAREKTYERLASALDRNTEHSDAMEEGIKKAFSSFAQSINAIVSVIGTDHAMQLAAIGNIPAAIMPTINELTRQIEDQKGSVIKMADDQNGTIQQILDAILRVEAQVQTISNDFESFQKDGKKLGDEIKATKQDVIAIKDDVSKLKPIKEEKTNVQSSKQSTGLDSTAGADSRSSRDDDGSSSKTSTA